MHHSPLGPDLWHSYTETASPPFRQADPWSKSLHAAPLPPEPNESHPRRRLRPLHDHNDQPLTDLDPSSDVRRGGGRLVPTVSFASTTADGSTDSSSISTKIHEERMKTSEIMYVTLMLGWVVLFGLVISCTVQSKRRYDKMKLRWKEGQKEVEAIRLLLTEIKRDLVNGK